MGLSIAMIEWLKIVYSGTKARREAALGVMATQYHVWDLVDDNENILRGSFQTKSQLFVCLLECSPSAFFCLTFFFQVGRRTSS